MARLAMQLNDWQVKKVTREPELKGKKAIGRGMFSAVFEGSRPDTVWKMTVDHLGYWLLNCAAARVEGPHFPKVFDNRRQVGEVRVGGEDVPIYLFEIERLEKLKAGSTAKRMAKIIAKASENHRWRPAESALSWIGDCDGLTESVREAVTRLKNFSTYYPEASVDMHMGNFMQRVNGEFVITDPFCDQEVVNSVRESGRRA